MNSKPVDDIFNQAIDFARDSDHEYVTCEHVLLHLLDVDSIAKIIKELSVDVGNIKEDLNQYLADKHTPRDLQFLQERLDFLSN